MNIAEGVRRGVVAQHDERRRKAMRATRFRRAVFQRRDAECAEGFSHVEHVERVEGRECESGGSVARPLATLLRKAPRFARRAT